MPHDVTMPQLGMAQDAGKIVSWLKAPGDPVSKGDALFEVETDKATMEVEAQASGFLTGVSAGEGDDVPVGAVIARISESADDPGEAPAPSADADAEAEADAPDDEGLPTGKSVTMPQLGMAQDTGLLVSWLKAPGDAVAVDDVLFEVETDKSTMEVSAGSDGYLAATLAKEGEEVPVGEAVAIISAEKPDIPVARSVKATKPAAAPTPAPAAQEKPAPAPAPEPKTPGVVAPAGKILASPKARRLALERGLDLNRLAEAGYHQPYHVKDLETLQSLPQATAPTAAPAAAARHLTAQIAADGFAEFADWAAQTAGLSDPAQLLAGLAAASLGEDTIVAVERFGHNRSYAAIAQLGETTETEDAPALRLRDMRGSRVTGVQMGAEDAPVLTITGSGALTITLECAGDQLSPGDALTLLSNFAGRMEQPLRHLL